MHADWLLASCRCKEATRDLPGQRPRRQLMPRDTSLVPLAQRRAIILLKRPGFMLKMRSVPGLA
jgi:hypothetical protein